MREFIGFKIVKIQVGDSFGFPVYHEYKLAVYKLNKIKNELDTRIGKTCNKASTRTQKHSYIKCIRKTSKQFRQD